MVWLSPRGFWANFFGSGRPLCTHNPGYPQGKGGVSVNSEREEDGVLPSDRHISKSKLTQWK